MLAKNSRSSVERKVTLTVQQEEEEIAIVDKERVEVRPVPVAEFGDYVADSHSNSNEIFKLQYSVCVYVCSIVLHLVDVYNFPGPRQWR